MSQGAGLPGLSVRRGVTFLMIYLLVVGFGLFSLARLRLDMYPDVAFPMMGIITSYEGASPTDVEELISRRIEEAVTKVEGVEQVTSSSKQGVSVVLVEFEWGTDLDMREIDVRKAIGFIEAFLPDDASEPMIFTFDPSLQPILFFGVEGAYSQAELREIVEDQLEPRLERIPGVASAFTMGGQKRQIRVEILPERLQAFGISVQQVVQVLRMENVTLPSGSVVQGMREFPVETHGQFTSVEDIEGVVVGVEGMVPVYLRDVARVVDGTQEPTNIVRNDGHPGMLCMVQKQSDANTVQTVRQIRRQLPEIMAALPRGVKLHVLFDQSEIVEKSLGNLSSTALYAFILAGLVLLFFLLSFRTSFIVAMAIPISALATFSIMDQASVTLNIISMAGLALAVGMLVDNSIVVVENIFRHVELGEDPRTASMEGAREVSMAITASTLTTIAVFAPILFVPGIAGMMFRDMALTICFSLVTSLLVALTLIPLAASRLLGRVPGKEHRSIPARAILGFLGFVTRTYTRSLVWALEHRWATLALAVASTVASGYLAFGLEVDFMPKADQGLILLQVEGPVGASLDEMDTLFRQIEAVVEQAVPERTALSVQLGQGEGFTALFGEGSHTGIVRIKLRPLAERVRRQKEIEEDLRARLDRIPGIKTSVMQPKFSTSEGDIVVEIYGHDLETARKFGKQIQEIARSTPGTADVNFSLEEGTPSFKVVLDRERLAALGLNAATVSSTISTLFQGTIATLFRDQGKEYDIMVRAPKAFRSDVHNLEEVEIQTPTGRTVPLSSVARVEQYLGPVSIDRKNQQRVAKVFMNVPGNDLGGVTADLERRISRLVPPDGFSLKVTGTAEDLRESFLYLGLAFMAAVLLVYMVMASQFESLLHPFVIILSVPLAGIGVVAALYLTGTSISVTAAIGVILLVGIVVNNAIVLVDFVNQLREGGMPLRQAIETAGRLRLRPILMTAATTVLAMIPLALEIGTGAETWSPLARTVIGGLTAATVLTTVVVPVIYSLVEEARIWLRSHLPTSPGTA